MAWPRYADIISGVVEVAGSVSRLGTRERALVRALRRGDEAAFVEVIQRYHPAMLRTARRYVGDDTVAEEIVGDVWLALVEGIHGFEGRASLKTWLFRILVNTAATRLGREVRTTPFSAVLATGADTDAPVGNVDRLVARHRDSDSVHIWACASRSCPTERLLAAETAEVVARAISQLPKTQAQVMRLFMAGWTAREVCSRLGVSDANQRVLLHRARSGVRAALEHHLGSATAS